MKSVRFKTHELLRYHFRCHGNLVTIATRYVADAYHHKDTYTKYDLSRTQDIEVIKVSL